MLRCSLRRYDSSSFKKGLIVACCVVCFGNVLSKHTDWLSERLSSRQTTTTTVSCFALHLFSFFFTGECFFIYLQSQQHLAGRWTRTDGCNIKYLDFIHRRTDYLLNVATSKHANVELIQRVLNWAKNKNTLIVLNSKMIKLSSVYKIIQMTSMISFAGTNSMNPIFGYFFHLIKSDIMNRTYNIDF